MGRFAGIAFSLVALAGCSSPLPRPERADTKCYRFEPTEVPTEMMVVQSGLAGPAGLIVMGLEVAQLAASAIEASGRERCGLTEPEARSAACALALRTQKTIAVTGNGSEAMSVVPLAVRADCGLFRIGDGAGVRHEELCREGEGMRVVRAPIPEAELPAAIDAYRAADTSMRRRINR